MRLFFLRSKKKLKELNIIEVEKRLGAGSYGTVFQVEGGGVLPHEKLALKVNNFASAQTVLNSGDVNGLTLPKHKNLNRTYALLTYDGKEVYCLDQIDKNMHAEHVVIGHLSKAIQGSSLSEYWKNINENQEIVLSSGKLQNLGNQLVSALDTLHQHQIAHRDLHDGNLFLELDHNGEIQEVVIGDFGSSCKFEDKDCCYWGEEVPGRVDWFYVGNILCSLEEITEEMEMKKRASFYDLLFSRVYGLVKGKQQIQIQGQDILSHPYFNEEHKQKAEIIPLAQEPTRSPKLPVFLQPLSLKELKKKDFQLVEAHAKKKEAIRSIRWDIFRNIVVIKKDGKFRVYQIGAGGAPALFSHKKLSEVIKFLNVM